MEYSLNIRSVAVRTFLLVLAAVGAAEGCTLQNGIRYVGGVFKTGSAVSREDCGLVCLSTDGCLGYTFYPSKRNCTLASSFPQVVSDSTALSGIVLGQCDFDDNFEYPMYSSTLGPITGVPNKEDCCRWCSSTSKCAGFTFFKSGAKKGVCDLKYATNNRVPNQNMSSGVLSGNSCVFEDGVDYRGFLLKTVNQTLSKTDCCALCRSTANCKAFSYVNIGAGSKTCVLKTSGLNRVANPNAVSAVATGVTCSQQSVSMRTRSPPPPPPRFV